MPAASSLTRRFHRGQRAWAAGGGMSADAARRSACATTARQHARSVFHGVSRNEGPSQQARTTVLHFLSGPLDGRVATIGHLAGELDFAGRDLALVAQLDVLIAKLRGDGDGHGT